MKFSNFDESLDIAVCLGVDPRHADQNIRLTTSLPHGTGKDVKVLVVTQGPKEKEAKDIEAASAIKVKRLQEIVSQDNKDIRTFSRDAALNRGVGL